MKLSMIRVLVAGVVGAGAFSAAMAQQEVTGAGGTFPRFDLEAFFVRHGAGRWLGAFGEFVE